MKLSRLYGFARNSEPPVALALQGGGAHGAFTWGVLDHLLEQGRFKVTALSGTSAGALNALALAQGLLDDGPEGARAALQRLWTAVGAQVPFDLLSNGNAEQPSLAPGTRALMQWAQWFSPYQFNPLGLNPLRGLLAEQIDFDRLHGPAAPRLFIAATHANSGRLRLFTNPELSVDVALASACLPTLQPAVLIDGEPYWDGGFSANPALFPLLCGSATELLIIALSPLYYPSTPVQVQDIRARTLEFAFNATFLREAAWLAQAHAEARAAWWPVGPTQRHLRRLHTHLIDAQDDLGDLPGETRLLASLPFLERLRDLGRQRAQRWWAAHGEQLGHRSTVDLAQLLAPPGRALAAA